MMRISRNLLIQFLLMFFLIVLSGCELTGSATTETTALESSTTTSLESSTTTSVESTTTEVAESRMSPGKSMMLVDMATYYEFSAKTLPTYVNAFDLGTTYVDLEEFIDFLSEGLITVLVDSDATKMVLSFGVDLPRSLRDEYGVFTFAFTITFDAETNQIIINDTNLWSFMNAGSDYEYQTLLSQEDWEQTATNSSVTIELNNYQIDIVKQQGKFYVPMYLANLFLSGSDLEVYEMGLIAIVYDSAVDMAALQEYFAPDETVSVATAAANTEKYLALYFDYFYGLKDDQNVDSYGDILEPYGLSNQDSFTDLHTILESFILDRNDLHTQMVTAGYNDSNFVFSTNYPIGSRHDIITKAQEDNACSTRSEEFVEHTIHDGLILEINAFTDKTKDFLKATHFVLAKNVVIDLSCNTGGSLAGVLELLTYMTNDVIEIKTKNPRTGQISVESYVSLYERAKDAKFYVITSPVTYSAANLFVSIVKDMDIGFVIGQDSLGGACAIQLTTLPDGTILVSSSQYALLNQAGELIEDGVEVDLEKELPIDWASYSLELGSLYDMLFDCSYAYSRDENHVFVQFDELATSDLFTNVSYQAVIRHEGSTWVVEHTDFSSDFTFDYWIEAHDYAYVIAIEVTYQFNGETFTEMLTSEVFDDHANTFEYPLTQISLEDTVTGGKSSLRDYDCFEVIITEAANYRFTLNTGEFPDVRLYDTLETLLDRGYDFDLVPGTYFVRIDYPRVSVYEIGLVILEDDTLVGVPIEIPDGVGLFELYVDYSLDAEWFEFTLIERSLITFSLNLAGDQWYDLKTNGIAPYRSIPDNPGNESIKLVLEPGNYLLTVRSMDVGTVTLETTCTTEFTDYTDYFDLNPNNNGILTLGENAITFEAEGDIDIYQLTITEEMDVAFVYDTTAGQLYRRSNQLFIHLATTTILHLYPGTYYFQFIEMQYPDKDTMWCDLVVVDNTDDDLVSPLEFGERQYTTSISTDDVDYYAFTAPETTEYRITWTGDLSYQIFNDQHALVYHSHQSMIFTLPAGEYTIEIGGNSFNQTEFIVWMIDFQVSDDLYRNATGLSVEFYTVMTLGIENTIHSTLEYEGDIDVFIFYVTTASTLDFETNSLVSVHVYDVTGKSYDTRNGATLQPGMYYFMVSQSHTNTTPLDYNVWIAPN